jgi:Protein of unknown function (DUF3592)
MAGTWFGIVACSLMGSAFGIAGLVRLVVLSWLRSNGISATGRVVRLERARYTTTGQLPYTPVAEFEVNGQRYEAKGASAFPPLYRVGDSVPVYYPRGRPDRGQIITGRESAVAWFVLALGVVFCFAALVIARLR